MILRRRRKDHPNYNQSTSPGMPARFWEKVDKSGDCWIWLNSRDDWGYGTFRLDGVVRKAHRVAFGLGHGAVPAGLWVLHRCDNPSCVNPAHLWLGTARDNARDREAKGRGVIPHLWGAAHGQYRHGRRVGKGRPAA